MSALLQSNLHSLPLIGRGKVRDIYAAGNDRLLIVQSDRISAFDVIMNEPVPGKGAILTEMSFFWFKKLARICANHLDSAAPESVVAEDERAQIAGRAMLVKKLNPLPIEAVCRGYLIGSGWKDYQQTGAVCGISLARRIAFGGKTSRNFVYSRDKSRARRTRRKHFLRANDGHCRGGNGGAGARCDFGNLCRRRRTRRRARHYHRRYKTGICVGRQRRIDSD